MKVIRTALGWTALPFARLSGRPDDSGGASVGLLKSVPGFRLPGAGIIAVGNPTLYEPKPLTRSIISQRAVKLCAVSIRV